VFTEQPSADRQNIYFIFEYVERDLERYLKLHNPLDINQIRVCDISSTKKFLCCLYSLEFYSTIINSCISAS
jgi:hypothetical protein